MCRRGRPSIDIISLFHILENMNYLLDLRCIPVCSRRRTSPRARLTIMAKALNRLYVVFCFIQGGKLRPVNEISRLLDLP
jgi:hypothetical protein